MNIINVSTDAYWNGFERWVADKPGDHHSTRNFHKYCGLRLVEDYSRSPVEYYRFELLKPKLWLLTKLKYAL